MVPRDHQRRPLTTWAASIGDATPPVSVASLHSRGAAFRFGGIPQPGGKPTPVARPGRRDRNSLDARHRQAQTTFFDQDMVRLRERRFDAADVTQYAGWPLADASVSEGLQRAFAFLQCLPAGSQADKHDQHRGPRVSRRVASGTTARIRRPERVTEQQNSTRRDGVSSPRQAADPPRSTTKRSTYAMAVCEISGSSIDQRAP